MFERAGLTSPRAGGRYRRLTHSNGGLVEPDVLLRDFLGREPDKNTACTPHHQILKHWQPGRGLLPT